MSAVKVPADVELEDKLAFGLTARQLALLAGSGVCAYGAYLLLTRSRSRAGRARRAAACRHVWAGARARTPRRHERRPTRARRRPLSACAQATAARPRRPPRATRPPLARARRDARHPGPAHPPQWARPAHRRQPLPPGRGTRVELRAAQPGRADRLRRLLRPLPQQPRGAGSAHSAQRTGQPHPARGAARGCRRRTAARARSRRAGARRLPPQARARDAPLAATNRVGARLAATRPRTRLRQPHPASRRGDTDPRRRRGRAPPPQR